MHGLVVVRRLFASILPPFGFFPLYLYHLWFVADRIQGLFVSVRAPFSLLFLPRVAEPLESTTRTCRSLVAIVSVLPAPSKTWLYRQAHPYHFLLGGGRRKPVASSFLFFLPVYLIARKVFSADRTPLRRHLCPIASNQVRTCPGKKALRTQPLSE